MPSITITLNLRVMVINWSVPRLCPVTPVIDSTPPRVQEKQKKKKKNGEHLSTVHPIEMNQQVLLRKFLGQKSHVILCHLAPPLKSWWPLVVAVVHWVLFLVVYLSSQDKVTPRSCDTEKVTQNQRLAAIRFQVVVLLNHEHRRDFCCIHETNSKKCQLPGF